jgi:hypothetical protein
MIRLPPRSCQAEELKQGWKLNHGGVSGLRKLPDNLIVRGSPGGGGILSKEQRFIG